MKRATVSAKVNMLSESISIHALVKRATFETLKESNFSDISIHALVKRATYNKKSTL